MAAPSTSPTKPIGFWLKLVDHLIDDKFAETLSEFDVTRHQWEIMNILSPGSSSLERISEELAHFVTLTECDSTVVELQRLIDRGWVDVAFEYYELTGTGALRHAELHRTVAKTRSAATAQISEADFDTTVRCLETIARELGWKS